MRLLKPLFLTLCCFFSSAAAAETWHEYRLDKLVNNQCRPKPLARMKFLYNDTNFWSAVSVAASKELRYHADGGGVPGYCAREKGSDRLRCEAYIKSYIMRAQNCRVLALKQLKFLKKKLNFFIY